MTTRAHAVPAVLGGPPAFPEPLHVGRPNVGDRARLHARLDDILDRRWLTNDGPETRAFEAELAARCGAAHVVAVSNATLGLGLLAVALGLRGEVVVPGFTFVATAHAMRWHGLEPVFADVDPVTHALTPAAAAAAIGPDTAAVLGVHIWGRPHAVDALQELCDARGIPLLFDAAHALGSSWRGRPVGTLGHAEVFSFHATKVANAFEGGAVCTDDAALAERLRSLRNFGFADYDRVAALGTNAKLSEIAAAMGRGSLEALDDFVAVNHAHLARYREALREVPGVTLLPERDGVAHNGHYAVCTISPAAGLSRDALVDALWRDGVRARRYFAPGGHRMQPYAGEPRWTQARLPVTERLAEEVLVLPTGTALSDEDVDRVGALIGTLVEQADRVRSALSEGGVGA